MRYHVETQRFGSPKFGFCQSPGTVVLLLLFLRLPLRLLLLMAWDISLHTVHWIKMPGGWVGILKSLLSQVVDVRSSQGSRQSALAKRGFQVCCFSAVMTGGMCCSDSGEVWYHKLDDVWTEARHVMWETACSLFQMIMASQTL